MKRIALACTSRTLRSGVALLALLASDPAAAQRGQVDVVRRDRLGVPQTNFPRAVGPIGRPDLQPGSGSRPAILLTGYWPPSNEAVRRFSPDPIQNPAGWIGSNWEGRGYDVYAYFPEFTPPNCSSCGKGNGDLEVDYQDTSADFWPIADGVQPIAVITFSRGFNDNSWEVEMNQYNRAAWVNDFVAPLQPTPAPPDASVPADTLRLSTLPVDAIVDAVDLANMNVDAQVCFTGDGGAFLSEFIAYHGVWYQSIHADPTDPAWCIAGGHVHVGGQLPWETARKAAEVTLRTVIRHVDAVLDPTCRAVSWYCPTSANTAGEGAYLTTTGSASIAANELTMITTYGPPNQFGLVFYGAGTSMGTLGEGTLCIAPPFFRVLPAHQLDAAGFLGLPLDLTLPPFSGGAGAISAGSTWSFQYWYRDPMGGPAGYNATNGVTVTFCP